MQPTPYLDLNVVLEELVARLQAALGSGLIGVYLQGSFAVGDFDSYSDVDWAIVVADELSAEQVDALQQMHDQIYAMESDWARHLEGSYFPAALLADVGRCGEELWFLDHGSRQLERSDHCNTIVVRWVLAEYGVALLGPPIGELVGKVSAEMLRQDVYSTLNEWGAEILADPDRTSNQFYQAFILHNYCRMLHSLVVGRVTSKPAATEWARQTLDPRWHGVIDRSWERREDAFSAVVKPADPADYGETLDFVRWAMSVSESFLLDSAGGTQ